MVYPATARPGTDRDGDEEQLDVAARLRRGDAELVADRVVDRPAARLDRARQVQLLDFDRRPLDLAERLLGALLEALPGAVRLVRREVGGRLGRLREHEHRVLRRA